MLFISVINDLPYQSMKKTIAILLGLVFNYAWILNSQYSDANLYDNSSIIHRYQCDLQMKKHSKLDGVGIFAGRDYKKGEVVERCITITLPNDKSSSVLLENYIYSHADDSFDIVLGYGAIYNHRNNNSLKVQASLNPSPRIGYSSNNETIYDFYVTANYDIMKGEEMFTSYGDQKWFEDRNEIYIDDTLDIIDMNTNALESVHQQSVLMPGCPMSKTEIINGKVYATQFIEVREVIEISRAIFVPITSGDDNALESYLWYSEHSNENALLLLGQGALYNTLPMDQLEDSNLDYVWYDINQHSIKDSTGNSTMIDDTTVKKVDSISCEASMLVEIKARRHIFPNEELTIALNTYGTKRRYVLDHWLINNCF